MASKKHTVITRPVARSERLLVEAIGNETVIYDQETNVAHALKPLAATVFMYATGENTVAEIAALASYRLDQEITEAQVNQAVEELSALALLGTPEVGADGSAVSRRDALKLFGAVGAGTVLVSSVAAPAAFAGTTSNGYPYVCGQYNNDLTALSGSLTPPPGNGWPQADVKGTGPGSPTTTGQTTYHLSDGCVVTTVGTCEITDNSNGNKGTDLQGVTSKSQCPVGGSGTCTYNSSMKGICYSYSRSTNLTTYLGEVPTGTSNPNSYCTNKYGSRAKFQGCTSGYQWNAGITGTYQCVPCDGSYDYQCCEVVCVPLTSGSPTTIQGAVTDDNIPVLPQGKSSSAPSGSPGDGYGIYDKFWNWSQYPNKWCTSNRGCNPGQCS